MDRRCIFLYSFLYLVLAVAQGGTETCTGLECKDILSFPLVDGLKATLKADIDVSKLNKDLKDFIVKTIQVEVATALKQSVTDLIKAEIHAIHDLKPSRRVAFSAVLSNGNTKTDVTENDVVVFDKTILNAGNAYDNTTGKFSCTADGLYFFSWTVLSDAKKDFSSELAINGAPTIVNVVDNDQTNDHLSSTTSVTVRLVNGDKVWIRGHTTEGDFLESAWDSVPVSVFTGFGL